MTLLMRALAAVSLLTSMGFVKAGWAQQISGEIDGSYCETYEECEEGRYVGPDGESYDENGNSTDDRDGGGGFYEDSRDDGDSGFLESGI